MSFHPTHDDWWVMIDNWWLITDDDWELRKSILSWCWENGHAYTASSWIHLQQGWINNSNSVVSKSIYPCWWWEKVITKTFVRCLLLVTFDMIYVLVTYDMCTCHKCHDRCTCHIWYCMWHIPSILYDMICVLVMIYDISPAYERWARGAETSVQRVRQVQRLFFLLRCHQYMYITCIYKPNRCRVYFLFDRHVINICILHIYIYDVCTYNIY